MCSERMFLWSILHNLWETWDKRNRSCVKVSSLLLNQHFQRFKRQLKMLILTQLSNMRIKVNWYSWDIKLKTKAKKSLISKSVFQTKKTCLMNFSVKKTLKFAIFNWPSNRWNQNSNFLNRILQWPTYSIFTIMICNWCIVDIVK